MISLFKKSEFKSTYSLGRLIGKGHYSEVYEATNKTTKEKVAVKVMSIKNPDDYESAKKEIEILGRLQHPNIVKLIEVFEVPAAMMKSKKMLIVMELVTGGQLFDRILQKNFLPETEARDVVRTIIVAIKYLHDNNIVHRDLKPENVMMLHEGADSPIKIVDFGFSKIFDRDDHGLQTVCGTPAYVAPEVLRKRGYGPEVDMWSIGVITYVLLCGFAPFFDENRDALLRKILKGEYSFPSPYWDDISREAVDFIEKLLVMDPAVRLTPQQALDHVWMGTTQNNPAQIRTDRLKAFHDSFSKKSDWSASETGEKDEDGEIGQLGKQLQEEEEEQKQEQ